jgi:hypothetical protein
MDTKKQPRPERGAPSVVEQDQPSFIDEEPRHGKQYDGGRKVTDQPQVGAKTPDTDADSSARR